jgi:alpha-ketoglutarate-dependent 2,4-dichlorophenoxyacetate dioxygenase
MVIERPLHPFLAAELDADVRSATAPEALASIISAMHRYPVGVFRNEVPVTDADHVAFSCRLGPVERMKPRAGRASRLAFPEIIDQSNLDENGEIFPDDDRRMLYKRANRLWHTDMSFHTCRATYSLLSAHVIPPGGAAPTEFADMRAAYDALSGAMKAKLEGLVAVHDYYHSRVVGGGPPPTPDERAIWPPAQHPLVHVNPGSGRKVLYLASHISEIVGMPLDAGRALVRELIEHATQPQFVYAHTWRAGDIVMWDNLSTMHRATPFDDQRYRRDMRRTTVREGTLQLEAAL